MIKTLISCLMTFGLLMTTNAQKIEYNDVLLNKIRKASESVHGDKAREVRYTIFAESPRTFKATIEGGDDKPYIQARTAYQLVFPKSTIMIDSGMDEEVHNFFGNGTKQPYFKSKNDSVQLALNQAEKIIITHEHGDHVAGVLRSKNYKENASKTIITYQQINTLLNKPQMPQLKIDSTQIKDFIAVDFYDILPIGPGVVLIKAPGHTPGEIMVYTKMKNGKEYLFTGDLSWSYAGIEEKKQKPKEQIKRIGEDETKIQYQLDWLNTLPNKGIQLIVSHDNIIQPQLVKKGILKDKLLIN